MLEYERTARARKIVKLASGKCRSSAFCRLALRDDSRGTYERIAGELLDIALGPENDEKRAGMSDDTIDNIVAARLAADTLQASINRES